jgi:gamma-butyrobetaine dioxygenase
MDDPIDAIAELFSSAGAQDYLGEQVTVAVHLLQTGALAQRAGAAEPLVAAALLHDVGHLVGPVSGRALVAGTDNHHGDSGADWLGRWFPPAVTEPVRLHVAAKRYLCAVEPGYFDRLSDASRYTLGLQGGTMSAAEVTEFIAPRTRGTPSPSGAGTRRRRTPTRRCPASSGTGRCYGGSWPS